MNWYDAYQKKINKQGTNIRSQKIQNTIDFIKSSFFDVPEYNKVNKNFNNDNYYDVWIYDGNKDDKILGSYKDFISYPYDTIQFDIGDYLHFNYGGDIHNWLITSLDKTLYYRVKGRIERCNFHLKWKDKDGVVRDYPAVAKEQIKSPNFDFNNSIIVNKGQLPIEVQYNEFTRLIEINQRFLMGDPYQAWKCTGIVNYTDTNTLGLTFMIDNIAPDDDKVNGIANINRYNYSLNIIQDSFEQVIGYSSNLNYTLTLNGQISNEPVEWISSNENVVSINTNGEINLLNVGSSTITCSMVNNSLVKDKIVVNVVSVPIGIKENRINPLIKEIKLNSTQNYTIFAYIDDVIQSDTFNISVSGANPSKYVLNVINGNNFSIKSLGFDNNPLVINCTNLVDGSNINFTIQLRNLW